MSRASSALACVMLAVALGSCGDDNDGDDAPEAPDTPAAETVIYSKTGGVAGISQRIEIAADGETTIETGNVDPETKSFTLPESQVEDVNKALDEAAFDDIESPGDQTGCADCFIYTIERGGHTVTFDDTNFPGDLAPAVEELEGLITEKPAGY